MKTRIKRTTDEISTGFSCRPIKYTVEVANPGGTWITAAICYNYFSARKIAKLYKETYGKK